MVEHYRRTGAITHLVTLSDYREPRAGKQGPKEGPGMQHCGGHVHGPPTRRESMVTVTEDCRCWGIRLE